MRVQQLINSIEKQHGVKILFAVESGSRAWGMESVDSDYDVRFVFVRPLEEYIQVNMRSDVIEHLPRYMFEANGTLPFYDFVGFDIFKFCRLLASSNPTVIEWLQSPEYFGQKPQPFVEVATQQFNPTALYYHYNSLCKQNYLKYIDSNKDVTYKRYLYCLRAMINAQIVAQGLLPPLNLNDALKLNPTIYTNSILDIIRRKKTDKEKTQIGRLKGMDSELENFIQNHPRLSITPSKPRIEKLNKEMRNIILGRKSNG